MPLDSLTQSHDEVRLPRVGHCECHYMHVNVGVAAWLWDLLLFLRFVACIGEACNEVQSRYGTRPQLLTCTDVLGVLVN